MSDKDYEAFKMIRDLNDQVTIEVAKAMSDWKKIATRAFANVIGEYVTSAELAAMNEANNTNMSIVDMINLATHDISIFDLWLHSMANSRDPVLKFMDQIIKMQKHDSRQ